MRLPQAIQSSYLEASSIATATATCHQNNLRLFDHGVVTGADESHHLYVSGNGGGAGELLVGHFLGVRVAMPDVVDTDQNRNNVGIDRDDVPIHAFQKVNGAVSADAEIDEFEVNVGARSSISS